MTRSEMQVIVVPGSGESRTYRLSYARLQALRGLAISLGVLLVFLLATWGYMISRVAQEPIKFRVFNILCSISGR